MEPLISKLSQFSAAVKAYCKTQNDELYQNVMQLFDLLALDSDSDSISKLANSYVENEDKIVDFFSSLTIMMNDHRLRKSVCFVRSFHLLLQFATESNGNFLSVLCTQHDLVNLTISLLLRSVDEKSLADTSIRQSHIAVISDCFEILFAVFATSVEFDIALYNLQSLVELLFRKIYKRDDEFVDASLLVLSAALTHERVANDVARLLERCTNLRAFAKALLKLSASGSASVASANASSCLPNGINGAAANQSQVAACESSTSEQDFRILCCTFVLSFLHTLPSRALVAAEASTEADKKRPVIFSCACLSPDAFQNGVALFRRLITARLRTDAHESPQASRHCVASCGLNVAFTLRLFASFLHHCAAEFIAPDRAANFARHSDLRNFLGQLVAALHRTCSSSASPTPPVAELIDAGIILLGTLRDWDYDAVNGALDATLFSPPSQHSEGTAGLHLLRKLVRMRKLSFSVRCARLAVDYAMRAIAAHPHSDTIHLSVSKLVAALFDNICKSCSSTPDSELPRLLAPTNYQSLRNSCDMLVVALDSLDNSLNTSSAARNAFARAFAELDSTTVCEVLGTLCSVSVATLQTPTDANNNNNNKKISGNVVVDSSDSRRNRNLQCAPLCALKFAQFALGAFDHDPAAMSTDEPDWRAEFARRTRASIQRSPTALARITHFVLRVCVMSTNGALNKSALRCLLALVPMFDLGGDALESVARRNAETNATCWWNCGVPLDFSVATSARLDSQFVRLSVDDRERESELRSTLPFASAQSVSSSSTSTGGSLSDEAKQVAVMSLYEHELSALHMRVACLEEAAQTKTLALEQSERLANQTRCRLLQSEADLRKCRELLRDALTRLDETACALTQVNERHTQSTQQLDRANEQLVHLRTADSQKRELQLECTALRHQLDVSNRRIATVEDKNVELDRLKQSLMEHNERMRAQYDHLQTDLARSEKERIAAANELSILEMQYKEEAAKLAVTEAARTELASTKREMEEELDKRTKEFDELRRSSIALSSEYAELKRRNAELLTTCSDTRAKLQRVEEENAQAVAELKKKDATLTMLREILQSRAL